MWDGLGKRGWVRGRLRRAEHRGGLHPDFGRSVTLFQPRGGGRLCQPNNTGTPRFSDLPTALPLIGISQSQL